MWSIPVWHAIYARSSKTKKTKWLAHFTYSTQSRHMQICWWHYTADFRTTTASHRKQQCFKYAWTTRNIVNAQPRAKNSCIHIHVSCIKSYFASFRPKKNLQFFVLAYILRFRMTKFVIAERWTAWQWVNNETDPATAAELDFNWEANKTRHAWQQSCWRHLLSNWWHKTHIPPTGNVSGLNFNLNWIHSS